MSAPALHNTTYPVCGCGGHGERRLIGGLSLLVCATCGKLTSREKGR